MAKLIFSLITTLTLLIPLTTAYMTAHATLSTYGFPAGLLPTAVSSYTLNRTTGDFSVNFKRTCKITLPPDNYLAEFSPTVRGKIVRNKIEELSGIRVWAFFKWWSITGIKLSADAADLVFEVGVVTAKYKANNFDVAPSCQGFTKSDS
ncbi:hypothetical protein vseg_000519 [Gypsophila vaccaria]